MQSILMVLQVPEKIRLEYHAGVRAAFPELEINVVADVAAADPFLDRANILITHGPYLRDRADQVFAHMPRLQWVQGIGVGVDNIIDRPTLRNDVIVTNIHGVHGVPMTEIGLSLLLGLSRDMPRTFRNQQAHRWERWPARLLHGKTIGILGVGSIAETLGPACKAMGMTVVGISGSARSVTGFDRMVQRDKLLEVVPELDYLLLLVPYTKETHHIVGAGVLAAMKPDAFLVNLARGGVIDEDALFDTLRHRRIAGAALDVFQTEPLPPAHPFWDLDNLIITCHQGVVHENVAKVNVPIICENIRRFVAGKQAELLHIVRSRG
jgi:D-2-hydroxyacid dehydrogenase (NADP+)